MSPTLTDTLAAMGYTHRPAAVQGRRDVLDGLGAVVCTGTAEWYVKDGRDWRRLLRWRAVRGEHATPLRSDREE